jgi:hypothetical protein
VPVSVLRTSRCTFLFRDLIFLFPEWMVPEWRMLREKKDYQLQAKCNAISVALPIYRISSVKYKKYFSDANFYLGTPTAEALPHLRVFAIRYHQSGGFIDLWT